ncbi:hypothetical protein [Bosea sp. (in: a-proteobacteria)]|uniref:hypothetical protein n=1 Tax=Bosea sp. (in: a-proteobacteria) TaxID=1871050 RepID=UPI003B3BA904
MTEIENRQALPDGAPGLDGDSAAPRPMDTPRRPGQPGTESETRPGPNPRSGHVTGPHAPYEPGEEQGLPANKHR